MCRSNRSRATACLYSRSTGGHGGSVLVVILSWLLCRVHLRWLWGGKNKRGWLPWTVSSLSQSRGRGGVWDRSWSRYRLWWFVHFTFFYGAASGWRCVASLSGISSVCGAGQGFGWSASQVESSVVVVSPSFTEAEKVMPFLAVDLAKLVC